MANENCVAECLAKCLINLLESYSPTDSFEDATTVITTIDIVEIIEEHTGLKVEVNTVFEAMLSAGYFYVTDTDSQVPRFVWLLKAV